MDTVNTEIATMPETALDIEAIYRKIIGLELELYQLRRLISSHLPNASKAQATENPFIERVPDILSGEPVIRGTRTPVRAIVEHWRFGHSAEEIVRQLPYLRPAQIFAALSYYEDHRQEIDRYIESNQVPVE